jgi:hypothetical protein
MSASEEEFGEEVIRLHRVFEDWFADADRASLDEFVDALSDGFVIVSPDGRVADKRRTVEMVASARGSGAVAISIRAPRLLVDGEMIIGQYEEHQARESSVSGRVSTVVLSRDPNAPGGFLWHLVHETWLPGGEPRQA